MRNLKMLSLIVILLSTFCACKKESGGYSISYSGGQYLGGTINFNCNLPTSTAFLWNFGDGTYDQSRSPSHTFLTAGVYTVTLTPSSGTLPTLSCLVGVGLDSFMLASACTYHKWHHTRTTSTCAGCTPSIQNLNDTTIPIKIVNPGFLLIGRDTVLLTGPSGGGFLVYDYSNNHTGLLNQLMIYAQADSIFYEHAVWAGSSSTVSDDYNFP